MRLLLDTHALLWTLSANAKLSSPARQAIADQANDVLVSSVCAFEITTKHRIGKLAEFSVIASAFPALLDGFIHVPLPISLDHAALAGSLDIPHKDPFDRLLIAQARIERVPIVSNEQLFDEFGVDRIW